MTVEIIKGSKRLSYAARRLSACELKYKKILLLPIPTTRDGVTVKDTDITLDSLLSGIDSSTAAVGYGLPVAFCDRVRELGGAVCDLLYDEGFQMKNAELTALGVLGELISEKGRAPEDVRFGVIGYGRIGSALVKYLSFLGARPVVYSSRESVRAMLGQWGIECRTADSLEELSSVDVLINTAPRCLADVRGAEMLAAAGVSVFDLASGENFGGAECVKRLPAVPDRVFAESAGYALADAVCAILRKNSD